MCGHLEETRWNTQQRFCVIKILQVAAFGSFVGNILSLGWKAGSLVQLERLALGALETVQSARPTARPSGGRTPDGRWGRHRAGRAEASTSTTSTGVLDCRAELPRYPRDNDHEGY